jgi:hypothetical protein
VEEGYHTLAIEDQHRLDNLRVLLVNRRHCSDRDHVITHLYWSCNVAARHFPLLPENEIAATALMVFDPDNRAFQPNRLTVDRRDTIAHRPSNFGAHLS